jgi:hypothetical protein
VKTHLQKQLLEHHYINAKMQVPVKKGLERESSKGK